MPFWLGSTSGTSRWPFPSRRIGKNKDRVTWHDKERHVVECLFGKLNYFRPIAMRHEKKAIHFMAMLTFAAVLLWLW